MTGSVHLAVVLRAWVADVGWLLRASGAWAQGRPLREELQQALPRVFQQVAANLLPGQEQVK